MFSLSLAQLRSQAHRLVATAVAIVIAVGFVVATLVLNDSSRQTVLGALASQYLHTDVVVAPDDTGEVAPQTLAKVASAITGNPAVAALTFDSSTYVSARLPGRAAYQFSQVTGLANDEVLRWQKLEEGSWPSEPNQIVTAVGRDLEVGSVVEIRIFGAEPGQETVQATVVGLTERSSDIASIGTPLFWAASDQARAWGATSGGALRVAATAGTTPQDLALTVRQTIQEIPETEGLNVRTGEQEAEALADALTSDTAVLANVLLVFAAIAVFVCALVIANTFSVLLAQRVRELALLRAVGAGAGQLRISVLTESLAIGLIASLLGLLGGLGVAAGISALAARYETPVPLAGITITWPPLAIGLAVGVVVTVIAAFMPVWKATRISPMAAMRPLDDAPVRSGGGLIRRLLGLLLLIPGAGAIWWGHQEYALHAVIGGGMATFLGTLLLARWLVPLLVSLVGRIVGPAGQVPGRLAALNATRNPRRTAATATALIVGVTLSTTIVSAAATVRAYGVSEIDETYPTDVAVSAGQGFPDDMLNTVTALPHVQAALTVTSAYLEIGRGRGERDSQNVQAINPQEASQVMRAVGQDMPTDGTIVFPSWGSDEGGWDYADGDKITLWAGQRKVELTVRRGSDNLNDVRMSRNDLATLKTADAEVYEIWVRLADDLGKSERADAVDAIARASADADPDSTLGGSAEARVSADEFLDTMLLIVLSLLGVAVIIAVIGVGNTMALSVLERRRESGVLRALGLTRSQLRWMLLWEAMLIAAVASAIGVALGAFYGTGAVTSLFRLLNSDGSDVPAVIPVGQLAAILIGATLSGALASVLPSRRAAKVSPVEAIASL
ncbi:ABC transporter permease [Kineosporia babensis]|uniref:FtsX-like permease family protein n=1 Tax=Kineosporia babensis TaxID=499548 RepID=A0A9X1NBJ2_9ACTN|nr:FtsX-like permease family protein [Kineosporia babensis]MCD5311932.1 FtsX-like permease family protein [Kineosporia babensis]